DATNGDDSGQGETTLHFLFDKTGNGFIGMKGSLKVNVEKRFEIVAKEGFDLTSPKAIGVTSDDLIQITGKTGVHIKGKIVRVGRGKRPAASQGDLVTSFITAMPCLIIPSAPFIPGTPNPCILSVGPPSGLPPMGIPGSITSGEPTVLVGG